MRHKVQASSFVTPEMVEKFGRREAESIASILAEYVNSNNAPHEDLVPRVLTGEPVQYVVGYAWFYGRKYIVTPDVLIPRPETEELVDWVLKDNKNISGKNIIDIGTGSGCIAISLAREAPGNRIYANDVSGRALKVARANARLYRAKLHFIESDFLKSGIEDKLSPDIIVSNPPYISIEEFNELPETVRNFEPASALAHPSGDPHIFYRKIAEEGARLKVGLVYVELNEFSAKEISAIFSQAGFTIDLREDLQGKLRMLRASI